MRAEPLRSILAFYPAGESEPQAAFQFVSRAARGSAYLFGSGATPAQAPRHIQSYAGLRLKDEWLIVVEARLSGAESLVKQLQSTGSPAVFVSREEALPPASPPESQSIFERLDENAIALDIAHRDLAEAVWLGHALTPAAEWMVDNMYLVRTQVAEVRRNLPRDYSRKLLAMNAGYDLARELVARTDHSLTEKSILEWLRDAQKDRPLSIAELWFFPLLLRMAIVDALRKLAARVTHAQDMREAAYLWANRLAAASRGDQQTFADLLRRMEQEPFALEPYFVMSVVEQLHDEEDALAPVQSWIEEKLNTPATDLAQNEHTREAADRVSTANAFGSLRALPRLDFSKIFEAVSLVERELRTDSAYELSDFTTRDQCRRVVERIARDSGLSEPEVARHAVRLAAEAPPEAARARHTAYYLLAAGVAQLEAVTGARVPLRLRLVRTLRRHATGTYLTSLTLLAGCFLAVALILAREGGVHPAGMLFALGALAFFPVSELSIQIVNALVISLLPPDSLPKMDFQHGLPAEDCTLVVVPMMLTGAKIIAREVEKLEVRFLANRDANLFFALLTDFTDAPEPVMPDDAALLSAAAEGIRGLNAKFPEHPFLLFHRARVWSDSEGLWIGSERKRGKIEDLNRYLCGGGSEEILNVGRLPLPVRYVITLDTDTQLPPGTARRMVETIAHPLNRVEIDPKRRIRLSGYTIIQPRVSVALPGATATRFTRAFADTTGTDPYCETVSDAQQDLFGEAIFHGKAIYDVQAFRTLLETRFPAETLLSHDLIEGAHSGVGLASDIELFENLPRDYASFSRRQHRWIRGDWQIAEWALPRVPGAGGGRDANPLTLINRWRILDNLRHSLVPVASLLLLILGWLISPTPGVWSLVVGLAVAIPAIAPLLDRLARRAQYALTSVRGEAGSGLRAVLREFVRGWHGAADDFWRALILTAFLPHQAWLSADAIARVAYRRGFSHRHMLEWQSAESTAASAAKHLDATQKQMSAVCGISALLIVAVTLRHAFAPTSVFLALWMASPLLLLWLSRSVAEAPGSELDRAGRLFLRRHARRTWRYFDDLVNAESNWLPPDNQQLALCLEVAQRTSPTNIGLWLDSALAATDFGYLTTDDFVDRCSQTFETLNRLERYEGHLLNWYDTRTLKPLLPRYISSVDSGNLLACLWVFQQGCRDRINAPLLEPVCLRGLSDTLAALREAAGGNTALAEAIRPLRQLLRGRPEGYLLISRLRQALHSVEHLRSLSPWQEDGESAYWIGRLSRELNAWIELADRYLGWIDLLTLPQDSSLAVFGTNAAELRRTALLKTPSLRALAKDYPVAMESILAWRGNPRLRPELSAWLDHLAAEYEKSRRAAAEAVDKIERLDKAADRMSAGINMRFLYDERRRLFAIGYSVGGPVEFSSYYDLLASECRLASLVAIAKGDVPLEHWFALSRPLLSTGSGEALLSWGGTMFEYLMPVLFTRVFENSLLAFACREAVRQQIKFGRDRDVPWGVSESAYSALDTHQIYQYRAFGVPALALKSGLEEDLVVAPYASMLALTIDPEAVIENLRALQRLGMEGPMGFYESIDFSRERTREGEEGVVIYSYMGHHQAMSLLALDDALHRGVIRDRFHGDLRVRSVESLLYERVPAARVAQTEIEVQAVPARSLAAEEPAERVWRGSTPTPRVHLHGNGRYCLMITNAGGGYSRWNDLDITRWRSDTARDAWGSFIYIRDVQSGAAWASAYQPLGGALGSGSARFSADRAGFQRRVLEIETVMEVAVAADDDVELRRLSVTNRSGRTRRLEFTSYMELALAPHRTDAFHPAFAKMFIETEYVGEGILLARRRPRSPQEAPVWAAHTLAGAPGAVQYETSREMFLGRGRDAARPEALSRDLSGSVGAVLDPIFSLRCRAALQPRERLELDFVTLAASSREAALALARKYLHREAVTRTFEMAWTRSQLEFRYLGIGPAVAHRFQELASHLLYPNWRLRPAGDRLARNRLGQPALWSHGISGDLPMLLVTASQPHHLPLVRELLQAHAYWRLRGFRVDLIILNQEAPSYDLPFHQQIQRLVEAHSSESSAGKPGGIFLREWNSMPEDHRQLLMEASSVVLHGSRGGLQQQLAGSGDISSPPPFVAAGGAGEIPSAPLPFLELPYFNSLGGFTPDGREYAIYLKPDGETPAPWANVMAHSEFGALLTESGLGCAWCGNSQSNRLTPWHNDPVSDPQSEAIYLRDEESGAVWTPTPLPIREQDAYRARHGQGYTVFEHTSHAIAQELTVFVPMFENTGTGVEGDPVKIYRLRLRNDSQRRRRLAVVFFAELVLGSNREDQQLHVQTWRDEPGSFLCARQSWTGSYTDRVAFAASAPQAQAWSGHRTQFIGRNGSLQRPAGLSWSRLDNRVGAGLDPAFVLNFTLTIEPGQTAEAALLLGEAASVEAAREIVSRYRSPEQVEIALGTTRQWWDAKLDRLQVRTPLLSTNFLLNRWLPYQTLSCRFWGRSGLHQSSGAFGFRDQLQDCLAFLYFAPELARAHILAAAARQFAEGDVQHWWHRETGLGVRTRCSDDMLWLPFAAAHYVKVTGDLAILDVEVPFLEGAPLKEGEEDRVFVPDAGHEHGSLFEHCRRALERGSGLGAHQIPLIGAGDWNDGLNRVGIEGRGESTWLAWFLASVLQAFARLAEPRDPPLAAAWRERARKLSVALEESGWDGDWYLRGFFDDGSPLGSHQCTEAQIDSLPQSWAVISGAADPRRARQAMESAQRRLVRDEQRLTLLFTPPFDYSEPHPGYIMGYPPGVRENGGQYTHGALWMALAHARMGNGAEAVHLLNLMSPIESSRDPQAVERYRGEPYVVAADVSSSPGKEGRAGWTWYTGSAGWMYRIWIEEVLGFQLQGDRITIHPAIPEEWDGFEITYRHRGARYEIAVRRGDGENTIELDGERTRNDWIPLAEEGMHRVTVLLAAVTVPLPVH